MKRIGVRVLMAPPRRAGDAAKDLEIRRLTELRELGVLVPSILGQGPGILVLSDIGSSLSRELKQKQSPEDRDALIHTAAKALAGLHRRGGYLGQALPRNMSIKNDRVGFFDFEEDPLEMMGLPDALARDWIFFVYGVARYYTDRVDALVHILKQYHEGIDDEARRLIVVTTKQLSFVDSGWVRAIAGGAAVAVAVRALRGTFDA